MKKGVNIEAKQNWSDWRFAGSGHEAYTREVAAQGEIRQPDGLIKPGIGKPEVGPKPFLINALSRLPPVLT